MPPVCYDQTMKIKVTLLKALFAASAYLLSTIATAEDAADILINQVYAGGGSTLYCKEPFSPRDRGVKADSIYGSHLLLRQFSCITARQCSSKPGYDTVAGDLHNLYPIQRSTEVDRRGSLFGDLPKDSRENECGYQSAFQTFDPPDHAKGNVARAMVYMHRQHNLPLVGNLEMYKRWNQLDPPDDDERARNGAIGRIQGNRNPYIDDPELVQRLDNLNNLNR